MKFFEVDAKTQAQEKTGKRIKMNVYGKIYKNVRIPWGKYILAALVGVAFFAISGSTAGVAAKIASGDFSDKSDIIKYVVISVLGLGTAVAGIMLDYANYNLNTRVKSKVWHKLLKLPTEFYDKESPNRMLSRITSDTDAALVPFGMVIVVLALLASMLGVLASMVQNLRLPMIKFFYIGIVITIVLVVLSLLLLLVVGFISANRLAAFTSFLSERFANFKLIKASGSEKDEIRKGHELVENRYKADMLGLVGLLLNYAASYFMILLGYISCFLLGYGYFEKGLVANGQQLIQFNAFMAGIGALLVYLGVVFSALGTGAGQATKFASLFDEKEEDLSSGEPMPETEEDITLKDVSFSYDGEHKALQNISCTIPKGKVTALIGLNGSGKSTLIKLIDRLYTNADGELLFGEEKAGDISLASWRERMSIVAQNAGLFSGTIRENIAYGVENASEEEIASVVRLSGLEDVLKAHGEGLDYDVGLNGCKLSGGEQQRVSIARAMLKNSDYLVLDEATANLDSKTAKKVRASIDQLMKGRTVIMIAHDFEAIKKADQVICLEEGQIVASGSHEELMEKSEFYQQLSQSQFEGL